MKNAHPRMGTLQFHKTSRDTVIDVRVRMDRLIAERDGAAVRRLEGLIDIPSDIGTLAACCLAIDAFGGRHVFRTSAA